jgi:4a-hydroxytetrahydrobiopterin dehydratase
VLTTVRCRDTPLRRGQATGSTPTDLASCVDMVRDMDVPDGWEHADDRLRRTFRFGDFSEAWAFMSRVALLAEVQGHHPNWSNVWSTVSVELSTHDAGNTVTGKDVALATAINALL